MRKRIRQTMRTPDEVPFYGVVEEAVMKCARDKIKEFLELVPGGVPADAASAMLHLDFACNLMEMRGKTVRSIWWNRANKAARDDVWKQLLFTEAQIVYNLNRFGVWWDRFHDQFEDFPVIYPCSYEWEGMPEHLRALHQSVKEGDFAFSLQETIKFIRQFEARRSRNPIQLSFDDQIPPELLGD